MKLQGIGVSPGSAHATAVRVSTLRIVPPGEHTSDPQGARALVAEALEQVASEMDQRAARASGDSAAVLEATAILARDPGLVGAAATKIAEGHGPVDALYDAVEQYCAVLAGLDDYMAERQQDLRDIFQRAAARMMGLPVPGIPDLSEPSVIVAVDLAPADTAALDPSMVVGIVTQLGGATSHTAILATQLGIPAVVGVAGVMNTSPKRVGLDGGTGEVLIDPTVEEAQRLDERRQRRDSLVGMVSGAGRTRDGHGVQILANIGTVEDAERVSAGDVEGVGLFRTEFCYLGQTSAPSVEAQAAAYRRVFDAFAGRKVVVRTLDAGADKPLAFADLGPEANPALGVRGLRLQRSREDLLVDQLAALAHAREGSTADVWVMAPMVGTADEASWFAQRCRSVGLPVVGTMIEIPAAAIRADHVLRDCDFASIGTNDLSQYLFAADRMDSRLAQLLSGWQPALWDVIATTVAGAGDKPVGICGEVAGDPLLALVAAGVGIRSLSMAVGKVGMVKAVLARCDLALCRQLAEVVRAARDAQSARLAAVGLLDPEMAELAGIR